MIRSSPVVVRLALLFAILAALCARQVHAQSVPITNPPNTPNPDSTLLVPQRDITDILKSLIGRSVQTEVVREPVPGLSISVLPSVGYNPAYGVFAGVSVALGGWLSDPKTTNVSAGSFGASYSTTGQVSLQFKSDFYLPQNVWALKGDWRYLDTSQPTSGLGSADLNPDSYPMSFVLYRVHQSIYRQVSKSGIYVGAGYYFDRYDQIVDDRAAAGESTPFTAYSGTGVTRTQSSGVVLSILVDTRDNAINASRGLMWNASIGSYPKGLGSDVDHQTLWSDFRSYVRMPRDSRNILAIWNTVWTTFGRPPYLDLPAIGWDTYGRGGRGFVMGHIRGPDQIYTEFEYRMRFTNNGLWGGVVFMNITTTTSGIGSTFGPFDPGYGFGVRLKFNKRTNTNLAADVARGQDATTRMFFGLQEVF